MNSVTHCDVFDLLEDLVDEAEIEAIMSQPREQTRAELAARGADLRRVFAVVERPALPAPPPPRTQPAKVIPIASRRPSRTLGVLRSISVAVAASFFGLFVWKQGSMRGMQEGARRPELSDSRPVPPPSYMVDTNVLRARVLRAQAHKLCNQGYWGECWDKLDEAGRLDKAGNDTLEVNEERNRIAHGLDEQIHGVVPTMVKPSLGPGEVPLRRAPR
jgi:hypothetical protein